MWSFMELLHSEIFPCYTGKRCRHTPFTSTRTKSLKSSRPPASFSLSYIELWTNCGTNSVIFFASKKISSTTTRTKNSQRWRFVQKCSEKTKKTVAADKGQTISRPSCLTVTVTRIFHRFTSLHWLTPDYFRWHFSHSQNTFFRDMKRLRLFVLLFYHILSRFTTKAAVSKPQQNRN